MNVFDYSPWYSEVEFGTFNELGTVFYHSFHYPYWVFFIFIIFVQIKSNNMSLNSQKTFLFLTSFLLVFFIGLRHEVGGDWFNYLEVWKEVEERPYTFNNWNSDVGYIILLNLLNELHLNIYVANVICAFVFLFGIYKFAIRQSQPIMVYVVAFPYIITIIGIGYTRQSVAYGFLLLAIIALSNKKNFYFFLLIIIGSLFYKFLILFVFLYIASLKIKLNLRK